MAATVTPTSAMKPPSPEVALPTPALAHDRFRRRSAGEEPQPKGWGIGFPASATVCTTFAVVAGSHACVRA